MHEILHCILLYSLFVWGDMHTVTARLADEFVDELDAECDERGFRNRTEYIRYILEHRDVIFTDQPVESDAGEQLADHEKRLLAAEDRLDELEASAHTHLWDDDERGN
jgi:metal-responsive CopG/Arc/MetJ family transcriptional regulator